MAGSTIIVHGSDGKVRAELLPGTFYEGRWQDVEINDVGPDEDIPLNIRKSLVGLTVPTVFGKEELESQGVDLKLPENSRLAYASDVIDVLRSARRYNEADELEGLVTDRLDMYVIEGEIYERKLLVS